MKDFEKKFFGMRGISVALNLCCFFANGISEESILQKLDKQKEVLLYYCEDGIAEEFRASQGLVSIELAPLDEAAIYGPGGCTNIKNMLPAFMEEKRQNRSTMAGNGDSTIGLGGWAGTPTISWATLIINGAKLGLQ